MHYQSNIDLVVYRHFFKRKLFAQASNIFNNLLPLNEKPIARLNCKEDYTLKIRVDKNTISTFNKSTPG